MRLVRGYEFVATFKMAEGSLLWSSTSHRRSARAGPERGSGAGRRGRQLPGRELCVLPEEGQLEPVDLTAHVVAHVARNEQGRFRIEGIDVELTPECSTSVAPRRSDASSSSKTSAPSPTACGTAFRSM